MRPSSFVPTSALLALTLFITSCKDKTEEVEPATAVIEQRARYLLREIMPRPDKDTVYYNRANPKNLIQEFAKGDARIIITGLDDGNDNELQFSELTSITYQRGEKPAETDEYADDVFPDFREITFTCQDDVACYEGASTSIFVDDILLTTGRELSPRGAVTLAAKLGMQEY